MAASKGFTGKGGKFSVSTDATAYTQIKQVKQVSFGGSKASFADITNLDSVGSIQERLPTTIDPGTVTLSIVSDTTDAGQLMLAASFFAQTLLSCKVEYPPMVGQTVGLVRTFQAYISSNGLADLNITDASTVSVEFTITGVITDTPGTAS